MRWLTQRNPAQRPSAVEMLRSELLPPSVADEQLTDLLRSIPERCMCLKFSACACQPSAFYLFMRSTKVLHKGPLFTDDAAETIPASSAHFCLAVQPGHGRACGGRAVCAAC